MKDWEVLLEKYEEGSFTDEEQKAFDIMLKKNVGLRKEVAFRNDLKRVAEAEDDDAFRNVLAEFEADTDAKKSLYKSISARWLAAASILLLLGAGYFFVFERTVPTQELFALNFEPYRNVVHPIVRGTVTQNQKTKAFAAYQTQDYKSALQLFTELYENEEEPYYLFYRANTLIQLNRAREAVPLLKKHLKTNDSLAEKSPWYLAMAYLQLNERENAIKMLNKVVADSKFNVEEATQLLEDLD